MKRIMKRSFAVAVAGALLALSASAAAGDAAVKSSAVKLSDAELDQITAGAGAFSENVIFNPSKHSVEKFNGRPGASLSHHTCINCVPSDGVSRATGGIGVLLPNGGIIAVTIPGGRVF